jgi:hypothetical protein
MPLSLGNSLSRGLLLNSAGLVSDPRSLPGLEAWYSARMGAAGVTASAAQAVSQMTDLTGKGRHLTQATGAAQPTWLNWSGANYAYRNSGNDSNNFSAPLIHDLDGVDVFLRITPDSWTPSIAQTWISRYNAGNGAWIFQLNASGTLSFYYTTDGTSIVELRSSIAVGFITGQMGWIRCVFRGDNGATQKDARFYTATDQGTNIEPSWTQLGATMPNAGVISFFNSTYRTELCVHAISNSGASGKVYYAGLRSIGGSMRGSFDPARATNGATSFVAATGETWTINSTGNKPAQIVGVASVLFDPSAQQYLQSGAFTLNQPETFILLFRPNTWAATKNILDGKNNDSASITQLTSSPQVVAYAGLAGPLVNFPVGKTQILSAVLNGAATTLRQNKTSPITGNAGTAAAGGVTVGDQGAPSGRGAAFQFSDLLVFSTAVDLPTQARVIDFLSRAGGLGL